MRLATLQTADGPRAVVQAGSDAFVDLHATDPLLPATVRGLLAAGPAALRAAADAAASPKAVKIAVETAHFLPPIPDPSKILCVGLNYRDHAKEGGRPIPTEPVIFGKFNNTLVGHGADVLLPRASQKVDYEAELVVVIGRKGRHIGESEALSFVAGYTVGHDVSARDWQFKGDEKQWLAGKSFDTFAPTGPVIVTPDELGDPHDLPVKLRLNGQTMQDGTTRELIFGVPALLAYVSQVFTLEPGDLIFTGTPPGVGVARKPQVFLKPGDVVEVEIPGIGILRNAMHAEP